MLKAYEACSPFVVCHLQYDVLAYISRWYSELSCQVFECWMLCRVTCVCALEEGQLMHLFVSS